MIAATPRRVRRKSVCNGHGQPISNRIPAAAHASKNHRGGGM
jgi:hypothetical protein